MSEDPTGAPQAGAEEIGGHILCFGGFNLTRNPMDVHRGIDIVRYADFDGGDLVAHEIDGERIADVECQGAAHFQRLAVHRTRANPIGPSRLRPRFRL